MKELLYRSASLKALSVVLAVTFLMAVSYVPPAEADLKHFILGGLAGAALILAGPAIVGALGAAGGAVAGATVAAGGVLVGAATAVGGFLAGAASLVGAGVLAAVASPLFLPVCCFGAGLLVGKILWDRSHGRHFKLPNPFAWLKGLFSKKKVTDDQVRDDGTRKKEYVKINDAEDDAAKSDELKDAEEKRQDISDDMEAKKVSRPPAKTEETDGESLSSIKGKYEAAYRKYVELLQAGKSIDDPEVKSALDEYKKWYLKYQDAMGAAK